MHIRHVWSHYLGISASFLCLIHCLALPVMTPFLPMLRSQNHWLVEGLFVALIALSTWSLFRGYQEHKEKLPLRLGVIGFLLLFSSLFFDHSDFQLGFSLAGAALMTTAHIINYRHCRFKDRCCPHH